MIKLISRFIGMKDFYLLFQLLKKEEFTINMGSMGVNFVKKGGYYEVSIVALGKDYGEITYLTKENLVKRKVVEKIVKVKPKKDTVVYHNEEKEVQEEDLF